MFRHALRLIWNRRRANRLLVVEIAATFVVTFVLLAMSARTWTNYRLPLGFSYDGVWRVAIQNENAVELDRPAEETHAIDDMLDALRALPGVVEAHAIGLTPFVSGTRSTAYGRDENSLIPTRLNTMTGDALAALGIRVVDGRPFGPEDEDQDYRPLLVNRTFVERAFGSESPLGRRVNFFPSDLLQRLPPEVVSNLQREVRVVGVIDAFRQHGELEDAVPYGILAPQEGERGPTDIFVQVAPGTPRSLEERIVTTVEAVGRGWRASVTPWEELRETALRDRLLPLRIGATLGAFLLAMVVLGLIGIVWQDGVRRTQEIGLRRAAGASAGSVRRQIVLEIVVVGLFGVAIGAIVAVQFPLLELVRQIDWVSGPPALAAAAALLLGLAALAALYPAWLASRREPADALRYE